MAPELERVNGIIILVYGRDHLPPHIHAFHGDDEVLIDLQTGEIVKGNLPGKKIKIVQKWLADNRKRAETIFYELNPGLNPANYKRKNKITTNKKKKK